MTNILITGITGFIGAHLADNLSRNPNNRICGIARSIKEESTFNALNLQDRKNVHIIFGNVNSYPDIEESIATYDIDKIYHLASQPIVQIAAKAPVSTYTTNIFGTMNILEAIRIMPQQMEKDISTLIMSSDKAYGSSNILPYTEDLPLNGSDIYSSSKSCEDIVSRAYAYNYDLPIVVARPCNTYGECDFHWSRLVPTLAKTYLSLDNRDPLILNKGSYHHIREYMYVKDTAIALESLLDNINNTKGLAFNVSPDSKYTTEEFVNKFISIVKRYYTISDIQIQFKEKAKTFKEIESQYLDGSKIRHITGWKPKFNLESGLKCTIDGYKKWFGR